jgi:hypothetical protein
MKMPDLITPSKNPELKIEFGSVISVTANGPLTPNQIFEAVGYLNRLANTLLDAQDMQRMQSAQMAQNLGLGRKS